MRGDRRFFIKLVLTIVGLIFLINFNIGLKNSLGFLSDSDSHPPPSNGTYVFSPHGSPLEYTFSPNSANYPAAGGTYKDPIFGETIRRITDIYSSGSMRSVSYSQKIIINADSTKILLYDGDGNFYIYSTSGTLLRTNPNGFDPANADIEWSWHPTNPDRILFFDGSGNLKYYSYSSNSSTLIKYFGGEVNNGGTGKFFDFTARYFCGVVGGAVKFWDSQANVFYTGEPSGISLGDGFVLMAPNGSGVWVAGDSPGSRWYSVNHSTHTFNSPKTMTDYPYPHGELMTDSGGGTWIVCGAASVTQIGGKAISNIAGILEIPVENAYGGYKAFEIGNWDIQLHLGANITGADKNWYVISYVGTDNWGSSTPWNPWGADYREEIFLRNVKTGEMRRLCHHRSRNVGDNTYYYWPKASLSADGTLVIYNSNGGRGDVLNYNDAYTVTTGLEKPSPPRNLRIIP